jgi:hypothetical protein
LGGIVKKIKRFAEDGKSCSVECLILLIVVNLGLNPLLGGKWKVMEWMNSNEELS